MSTVTITHVIEADFHVPCRRWARLFMLMCARYFEAQRDCPSCQAKMNKLCDEKWGVELLEEKGIKP